MGAWRYRLSPGQRLTGPDPATGRGQYWLVAAGTLCRDDEALPPRSCCFVAPDETAFIAAAGPDGLDVLAMQFPIGQSSRRLDS